MTPPGHPARPLERQPWASLRPKLGCVVAGLAERFLLASGPCNLYFFSKTHVPNTRVEPHPSRLLGDMSEGVSISQLAPPAVSLLIVILAYGSQIYFRYIEPYALEHQQTLVFNATVACIWICYARACWSDPGRVPSSWMPDGVDAKELDDRSHRYRWCKKCEAFKPPRAHHCKTCNRYRDDLLNGRFL